jgi:8-oxo-dGTP pyrophosphatase MutT (NUDIX family)
MIPALKQVLSQNQKRHIFASSLVPAAVIVPLYCKEGQYCILLIKRTENVKNHRGEISFPGGVFEERDGTLLNTALRECAEEIGLISDGIEILGELDDEISVKTSYVISPFVALVPWPYRFTVDGKETEEIIETPIHVLLDNGHSRQEVRDGEAVTSYFYRYQDRTIWGATARILNKFLVIYTQVAADK